MHTLRSSLRRRNSSEQTDNFRPSSSALRPSSKVHRNKGAAKGEGGVKPLQTKFDWLNSETNVDLLQIIVEEKEKRLHYNLQEAEDYKQKMLHIQAQHMVT